MIGLLASLLGSKAGRIAIVAALSLAAAGLVLLQAFRKGAAGEQAKQTQASLDALRKRIASDDRIEKMAPDARRRELSRWMSDEGQ